MKISENITNQINTLKRLHGKDRLQYIWDYYKLHMAIILIFLYIIGYILYGQLTHKESVLYTAFVNVNAGEEVTTQLTSDFIKHLDLSPSKNKVYTYTGLYLTTNDSNPYFEYTYASRTKILGAIGAEQLDIVLMNKEAFDAFSEAGYLCDLKTLLSEQAPDFYQNFADFLVDQYGLDVSKIGLISEAGFDDIVYAGIVENSQRKETAMEYLKYILWL